MPKVHRVEKARKDYPEAGIKRGQSYYWWKFRYGGKRMSLEYPKPAQLTQSSYLQTVYGIQDYAATSEAHTPDELEELVEDLRNQLEELRDETESSLDNMPEGLQEGDTGQLLQERIDALEEALGELDNVDIPTREGVGDELGEPDLEVVTPEEATQSLDDALEEALDMALEAINEAIGNLG